MIFLFLSAVFGDALVNMVAEDEEARGLAYRFGSDTRYPTRPMAILAWP